METPGQVCGQHVINVVTIVVAIAYMASDSDYIRWGPSDTSADPPRPVDVSAYHRAALLGPRFNGTHQIIACCSL